MLCTMRQKLGVSGVSMLTEERPAGQLEGSREVGLEEMAGSRHTQKGGGLAKKKDQKGSSWPLGSRVLRDVLSGGRWLSSALATVWPLAGHSASVSPSLKWGFYLFL